ncbi:TetR/AcrR family transcriptional regulator [Sphingomonas fennica]|uniref:Transcriptional regulator n=1 Tax=Edaphosphingomonas fennica TaxID=114404 RepID=A0A2T4HZ80_9SPHN|nr:TetR family transcriptional regulator C-terminal domain-containing protein [Sphingomonas fennica]PTD21665.1 transcriptional regulator [Sphingomonas fennica]
MPKIVDHDEQRRIIAAAAVRWIASHGLETLSQRNVAALSGRSKGNVQHYFPDKASLMFGALRWISGERAERERPRPGDPQADDPFATLSRRLYAVLPTDEQRADEWRVRLSLYVYAHNDPDMQAYLAEHGRELAERGVTDVRACQEKGEIRADLDPALTYQRLSAAVSGIAVAALANGGELGPDDQKAMLAEILKSIAA